MRLLSDVVTKTLVTTKRPTNYLNAQAPLFKRLNVALGHRDAFMTIESSHRAGRVQSQNGQYAVTSGRWRFFCKAAVGIDELRH
jgi:hypothetical protein